MIETLGERQQELLKLLLENKAGLTVEELSQALEISRNAVRQHLAGLERDGLLLQSGTRPTGGRPEQLYLLTDKGREIFPRQYSWFSRLLIESIREQAGSEGLGNRLADLGNQVASQLRSQSPVPEERPLRVSRLAALMTDLGYGAKATTASDGAPTIEANNCVFHDLAARYPEVCRFDLALMATFAGNAVEHQECMVRGGSMCRFRFPVSR
ncbi:MAG TPA: HTH domain-containing protein [Burkholderiales bacterium]|nr:HTH domain-containing protein [Burkholderiales bacterium]